MYTHGEVLQWSQGLFSYCRYKSVYERGVQLFLTDHNVYLWRSSAMESVYILGTNPCMREEYNCFDGSQCIPM